SDSLVSWRQATSGCLSSSHGRRRGTLCLTELTFQVATRMRRHDSRSPSGSGWGGEGTISSRAHPMTELTPGSRTRANAGTTEARRCARGGEVAELARGTMTVESALVQCAREAEMCAGCGFRDRTGTSREFDIFSSIAWLFRWLSARSRPGRLGTALPARRAAGPLPRD